MTSHDFTQIGRFAAGAMGQPGQRVFYLQAFGDGIEVSLKAEKQQVQVLADHLVGLLDDLPAAPGAPEAQPAEALPPSELAWAIGSISLGVDRSRSELVVLIEQLPDEEAPDAALATVRLRLTPDQVRAYAAEVAALVAAGRPPCRLCGQPIDPRGHACARLN